jgi:hypothetical protein
MKSSNKKMTTKIEPCPFCGYEGIAWWKCGCGTRGEPCGDRQGNILSEIMCDNINCKATVPTLTAWNRRVK